MFQRAPVAGDLADPPGQRQRAHDRGDQRGAEDARAEHQAPEILAEQRRQRVADLADAGEARRSAARAQRRRRGDQHRAGQALGQHRAERRIPARGLEIVGLQLFVGDGRLLVEDHPRVEASRR